MNKHRHCRLRLRNAFHSIFRPLIISCTCQYIGLYAYIHIYACLFVSLLMSFYLIFRIRIPSSSLLSFTIGSKRSTLKRKIIKTSLIPIEIHVKASGSVVHVLVIGHEVVSSNAFQRLSKNC
jgi:hypothetical protein